METCLKSSLFIFYVNASDAAVVTQLVYVNDCINWDKRMSLHGVSQALCHLKQKCCENNF